MFGEGARIELIDGELLDMTPIDNAHAFTVDRLVALFAPLSLDGSAIVRVQNPLRLGPDTEVYPDVALLSRRSDLYRDSAPTAKDAMLVIEVADASLRTDRECKAPLYARCGVREYWLIDLIGKQVEIFRAPSDAGYASRATASSAEAIAPSALPAARVSLASIWG
jgi:Uma2 family endonuclease